MSTHFYKYHGAGNDFIIIDNKNNIFKKNAHQLIKKLCHRQFGIGADGLMLLESHNSLDFNMIYYNSNGLEGTMCGNGGRCIVAFAKSLNLISDLTNFNASDGPHQAKVDGEIIFLKMSDVTEIKELEDGYFVNTGSPHFVIKTEFPHKLDINNKGREIRYQKRFMPDGANINFISEKNNIIEIATYERGVETETLSCGTGSVASAVATTFNNDDGHYVYEINAKGGKLQVSFEKTNNTYSNIWLSGPAVKVYEGYF